MAREGRLFKHDKRLRGLQVLPSWAVQLSSCRPAPSTVSTRSSRQRLLISLASVGQFAG